MGSQRGDSGRIRWVSQKGLQHGASSVDNPLFVSFLYLHLLLRGQHETGHVDSDQTCKGEAVRVSIDI